MAELTVPSRKRRALAEALMNVQGPQPQMVGNRMVYDPNAGLLSGLAQAVGGYMKGKEYAAADAQSDARRQELARLLGQEVSGGASGESGPSSPSSGQPARPASYDDFRRAAQARILAGDDEGAAQFLNYGKAFANEAEYFQPENLVDPQTGKVFGGQYGKDGTVRKLPYPIYKAPSSSYDPVSGALIQTGGLPLEMIEGYAPPAAAPAPGAPAAPAPTQGSTRVIDLSGGKETPAARKQRIEEERQAREDARRERELQIKEREAAQKEKERLTKQKAAMSSYDTLDASLSKLEQLIRQSKPLDIINPASTANSGISSEAKAAQLAFKEIANLGAIQAPDVPFIQGIIPDPTNLPEFIKGKEVWLSKLQAARERIKRNRAFVSGEQPAAEEAPASRLGRREL